MDIVKAEGKFRHVKIALSFLRLRQEYYQRRYKYYAACVKPDGLDDDFVF